VKLSLSVHYNADYPDSVPDLSLECIAGDLSQDEMENLLTNLRSIVCAPCLLKSLSDLTK
jgi:hypothetical protein